MVTVSIPFFMAAIAIREKKWHWSFSAFILCIPAAILIGTSLVSMPNRAVFEEKFAELQSTVAAVSPPYKALDEAQQEAVQTGGAAFTSPGANIGFKEFLEQLSTSPELEKVKEFLDLSVWQRAGFLVFGMGASSFLFLLLISFANIVFVDFGFEQIERLRAIIKYIRRRSSDFSESLKASLTAMPMVQAERLETPFTITQHGKSVETPSADGMLASFLSSVWRPLKPKNVIYWQGYSFQFAGKPVWGLREFSIPLPIVLMSVGFIGYIGFRYGSFEALSPFLKEGPVAVLLAVASVLSFIVVNIVALQGMFTIYKRMRTLVIFALLMLILFLGAKSSFGPYTVIALFGAVGLLDYVYDWRGRKT
jgi:hypothetical protein